jgi:hypothetical protein
MQESEEKRIRIKKNRITASCSFLFRILNSDFRLLLLRYVFLLRAEEEVWTPFRARVGVVA